MFEQFRNNSLKDQNEMMLSTGSMGRGDDAMLGLARSKTDSIQITSKRRSKQAVAASNDGLPSSI